jgi:predicted lipoprotein with Yx(FWY)xxD motif
MHDQARALAGATVIGPATRRRRLRPGRITAAAAVVGLATVAAACASSGASSPVSTKASGHRHPPTPSVTVTSARVGSLGTVLVDQAGFTLYRNTTDGTNHSNCTGACASEWPPLTVPPGSAPPIGAGATVNGALLTTIIRPDGSRQVAFGGMPLYLFKGDTKAGQANGQGVGGVWFVVNPSQAAAPATATPTTTPATTTTPTGAVTPATATPAPMAPPVTSPPATSPPVTSPPVTSPPSTAPPPTTPPTTSGGGYGY